MGRKEKNSPALLESYCVFGKLFALSRRIGINFQNKQKKPDECQNAERDCKNFIVNHFAERIWRFRDRIYNDELYRNTPERKNEREQQTEVKEAQRIQKLVAVGLNVVAKIA